MSAGRHAPPRHLPPPWMFDTIAQPHVTGHDFCWHTACDHWPVGVLRTDRNLLLHPVAGRLVAAATAGFDPKATVAGSLAPNRRTRPFSDI
jgi:hypothetical protein